MGNTSSSPSSPPSQPPPSNHPTSGSPPAGCPMHQSSDSVPSSSNNPLNQIPSQLSSTAAPGQKSVLPLERTISSIPRSSPSPPSSSSSAPSGPSACPVNHSVASSSSPPSPSDEESKWVYPSPQQFHNALVRKGKAAPEESVEMMVQIHNWLNEAAWSEVRRWESQRIRLARFFRFGGKREDAASRSTSTSTSTSVTVAGVERDDEPELAKFMGRPGDLSPKARWHMMLGKIWPDSYSATPPFDRHDWLVRRPATNTVHRYVIDYYSCPDDEAGNPVFSLDVRPALDSPGAVVDRLREWSKVKWGRWFGTSGMGLTGGEVKAEGK